MIKVKTLVSTAVMGLALAGTSAQAAFTSFWFDPDGAATGATAFKVDQFDIASRFLVQNTYTGPTTYNFYQWGTANLTGTDGNGDFSAISAANATQMGNIRVKFEGSGLGNLVGTPPVVNFTGGTLGFYNPAYSNNFAQFQIIGGDAVTTGLAIPNGASTLIAKAISISAGYFFKDYNGTQGEDLSGNLLGMPSFGFATTNISLIQGANTRATADASLSAAYSDSFVQSANGANVFDAFGRPTQFYASAGGQYQMDIPEPESLALMGLGMLALAASRRRKAAK